MNKPNRSELAWYKGTADDLRELGWCVAVHNDYKQGLVPWTFWLMTLNVGNGPLVALKGEGRDDADALDQIRTQVLEVEHPTLK